MRNADPLTPNSLANAHLSDDLLLRLMDDEVSLSEAALVEGHLSQCERCRQVHDELRLISVKVESAVTGLVPSYSRADRDLLAEQLELRERANASFPKRRIVHRLGWAAAIAATVALGISFLPQWKHLSKPTPVSGSETLASLEVDGESFVSLPYSNPDLPVSASHIVQMRVPVSSLADAGIVLEPISTQISRSDDSVLADVLLGIDGQPRGVHVLSAQ